MTFDQGTNDSNVQVLSIDIWDDQLLEGTESFVVSGNVTPPASFVPGGDMVTVNILDSDGKLELFYTNMQSWCLNHSWRNCMLHWRTSSVNIKTYRLKKVVCNIPVVLMIMSTLMIQTLSEF